MGRRTVGFHGSTSGVRHRFKPRTKAIFPDFTPATSQPVQHKKDSKSLQESSRSVFFSPVAIRIIRPSTSILKLLQYCQHP